MLVTVVITMVYNCSGTALKSSYYLNLVQGIISSCCHDASNNFLAEKIDSFKRLYIDTKTKNKKTKLFFSSVSKCAEHTRNIHCSPENFNFTKV